MLDVVDFNKSCSASLPLSGLPIYYFLCPACSFCFAPEMQRWPIEMFAEKVYNQDYVVVDPAYVEIRPHGNARSLLDKLPHFPSHLRHLDYGGGAGDLSRMLCDHGWSSTSYDPFYNKDADLKNYAGFDFITAYEVFEHVPDINVLMQNLQNLLKPDGVIFFTTSLSDGHIKRDERLSWWYASPRNGHISLFSAQSLSHLALRYEFQFASDWVGHHAFYRTTPEWIKPLFT